MNDPKIDPATLALRAPPRPVTRLSRRTLIIAVAVIAALVLGATLWSLQRKVHGSREMAPELHNVDRVSRAEGLDQLPRDYSKIPSKPPEPAAGPPVLGEPLPGDLGGPLLRTEREAASNPTSRTAGASSDPDVEAARAERLALRREAEEAAKAPLFFRVANRDGGSAVGGTTRAIAQATQTLDGTSALAAASGGAPETSAAPTRPAFLDRPVEAASVSTHVIQNPVSPYQVMAGTVIAAALITGINSDLPGQVLATVTEPVYDTRTARYLLIPQGTRLIGEYDSQIAFGQRRVLLAWNRLIFPDTSSLTLDRLPGIDAEGYAGLADAVDRHWQQLLASAAVSTVMGVAAELAAPERNGGPGQVVVAARQSVQDTVNQAGQELTMRNVNLQPTLTVRPGFPVRVIVRKDLVLRPYQPAPVQQAAP